MASTSKEEDTTAWGKAEKKFENKHASEYYDPCQEFATRSIKCMRRNAGDRDMCGDYFQAYRDCKKEWLTQRKLAKANTSTTQS
ncbi:putative cytochrome c oxidase-assembly factor cox23, mitochondrial precursor [Talaromyces proteolyticus]|uniref:Cytochrome c oxidase-assembly factor cox23, mitochondrial n=1 Tax=Talaromyces proteolyticus TaxID=1131652 RepID=A0AAD4KIY2_9EURO|nr:putative cytochrome c oxidase-assembly factor cox23, mitochondrial precursor [Talaromyces proteolyticus]KAH8693615.1 putative cytochrome c oxidase-assembly factor cox23, mitochondrial precursor [Talaromyces proteolyticus]